MEVDRWLSKGLPVTGYLSKVELDASGTSNERTPPAPDAAPEIGLVDHQAAVEQQIEVDKMVPSAASGLRPRRFLMSWRFHSSWRAVSFGVDLRHRVQEVGLGPPRPPAWCRRASEARTSAVCGAGPGSRRAPAGSADSRSPRLSRARRNAFIPRRSRVTLMTARPPVVQPRSFGDLHLTFLTLKRYKALEDQLRAAAASASSRWKSARPPRGRCGTGDRVHRVRQPVGGPGPVVQRIEFEVHSRRWPASLLERPHRAG
jgi:hypothetical protein